MNVKYNMFATKVALVNKYNHNFVVLDITECKYIAFKTFRHKIDDFVCKLNAMNV